MAEIKNAYFKSRDGFGRTDLMRVLRHISRTREFGVVNLYEQTPKISLIKEKSGELEIRIGDTKFNVLYAEINETKLQPAEAIKKFTENFNSILILKEEEDSSRFLKIIKEAKEIFIEFNIES